MAILVLEFKKNRKKMIKQILSLFIQSLKVEMIINESDSNDVLESVYTTIISNKRKSLGKGSDCLFDSVIDQNIHISKYGPLGASI